MAQSITEQLEGIKKTAGDVSRSLSQFQTPEQDISRRLTEALPEFDTGAIKQQTGEQKTLLQKFSDLQKQRVESEFKTAQEQESETQEKAKRALSERDTGFVTNVSAVRELEETGRKRMKELEKARQEALLSGEAETARTMLGIQQREQELITQGRQSFFSNLLNLAGFETPQQKRQRELQTQEKQTIDKLAIAAPGIVSPDDDLKTALEKYKTSPAYKNDIYKGELELSKLRADIAKTQADTAKARADAAGLQIDTTNPQVGSLNRAIQFLTPGATEAQRKDILRSYQQMIKEGDVDGAKEYVKRVARSVASPTEEGHAIKRNQLLDQVQAIQTALNEYKSKGGDTGLLSGTKEAILRRVGRTGDPDLVKIASSITTAMQNLRVDITGAAFGDNEQKEYNNLFPRLTNDASVNDALLSAIQGSIKRFDDSFYVQMLGETNFRNLFGESPSILGGTSTDRALTGGQKQDTFLTDNLFAKWFK